ncbi:nitrogenase component 1 [Enterobacter hormaechei]|nr:nitrogenase component 1 [Enterobacter hormaechei]MDF3675364.1 nitrogenase component 1 [Enterobacter hormaechei]
MIDLKKLPKAWFNLIPYREVGLMTAVYLNKEYGMPYISIAPMGAVDMAEWIDRIANETSKTIVNPFSIDLKVFLLYSMN